MNTQQNRNSSSQFANCELCYAMKVEKRPLFAKMRILARGWWPLQKLQNWGRDARPRIHRDNRELSGTRWSASARSSDEFRQLLHSCVAYCGRRMRFRSSPGWRRSRGDTPYRSGVVALPIGGRRQDAIPTVIPSSCCSFIFLLFKLSCHRHEFLV